MIFNKSQWSIKFIFKCIYIVIFLSITCLKINAQSTELTKIQLENNFYGVKVNCPIKIDGILNEQCWDNATTIDSLWRKFPDDIGRSKVKTRIKIIYDNNNLYFGFICYDTGKSFIQTLKRDGGHDGNDCIAILLDPNNKHNNGYFFVLNALNAQSEDQKTNNGGNNGINWSWDSKWVSATKEYAGYWIAEIAIPFKSIRFDPTVKTWGINFLRVDTKNNEYSVWAPVPVNFPSHDLGFTGALHWASPPPKIENNLAIIPYISGGYSQDNAAKEKGNFNGNFGFDAKWTVTSSLNFDVTYNPDFSQVEVDQQVTNLTRFNIFYPEKRNFFLENADLFAEFGISPIRPFYSRRIGIDKNNNPVPIIYGARLSGNLGPKTRIGLMNLQTNKRDSFDDNPKYYPENFTAFTIQQQVLKRSNLKFYFLNHENYLPKAEAKKNPNDVFGRNAGLEFNYSNQAGSFNAWVTFHKSFKPLDIYNQDNNYAAIGFEINNRHWGFVTDISHLGTNYYTDLGYLQRIDNYDAVKDSSFRLGYNHLFQEINYKILPKKGKFTMINLSLESFNVFNPSGSVNGMYNSFNTQASLRNTSSLYFNFNRYDENLVATTSPTGKDTNTYKPLPIGAYHYQDFRIGYSSDFRKKFSYRIFVGGGTYYNGTIQTVNAQINFRNQPHLSLSLNINYNHFTLPENYGSADLFLISPQITYNFTTKLFWTNYLQFNTQQNNFNINSRIQYRFKPLSDLFIVYTDNYYTDTDFPFKNKNRAIVFKISYWFN